MMGHERLEDTTVYLHLSQHHLHAAINPLDQPTSCIFPRTAVSSGRCLKTSSGILVNVLLDNGVNTA